MAIRENKLINYLTITLCFSVCFQRLFTSIASIFFILSILLFFFLIYQRKKTGTRILQIDEGVKGYYYVFGIFIVTLMPAALCTGDIIGGMGAIVHDWIYRWFPFFAITLFIRDKQILAKMLLAIMIAIGFDCLVAIGQSVFFDKYRPGGLGRHPMFLAAILAFTIPVITIATLDKRFSRNFKLIAVLSLICCLIGSLVVYSRGLWLTLFVVLPLISWTYIKTNKKCMCIAGIICCLLAVFFVLNPTYQHRLVSITNITTDRSNADRIIVWESAQNMIRDYPIVGVGPNKFKEVYDARYKSSEVTQDLPHSHNNFIQVTAEYGMIGLCGFLYFTIYMLKRNYSEMKSGNPYARMRLGCLLGFFLFGLIDYTLNGSATNRIFWFIFAVLVTLDIKNQDNERIG